MIIIVIVSSIMITMLVNYLSAQISDFHYGEYEREAGGSGIKTILEYLMLFVVVAVIYTSDLNRYIPELLFLFFIFDVMISIINYSYGTAGRVHYLMMPEYLVLFSSYVHKPTKKTIPAVLLLIVICLLNGFLTYVNFTQGPEPYVSYKFFNPFH